MFSDEPILVWSMEVETDQRTDQSQTALVLQRYTAIIPVVIYEVLSLITWPTFISLECLVLLLLFL